jgi:hypothetical protein
VPELLLTCVQRYLKDPKGFEAKLLGRCVLLYEPPEEKPNADDPDDADSFRFRTSSGVTGSALGGGDPTVAYLEKTKDNAFLEKTKDNAFQRRVTLGRTGNNDIEIDAQSVSRFHAWFVRDENTDQWMLVDAGSKNGTEVSGKKLKPKVPMALLNAARLKVGQVELSFFTPAGFVAHLKRRSEQ